MTEKLSAMFDGEQHWLEPGTYFPEEGATLVVDGWEEAEEEDVLSPFEAPSMVPVLRDTRFREPDPRFPLAMTEQAWGSFSISLSSFANICGFDKKQYQHVWPGQGAVKGEVKWSFQTSEPISERM